MSRLQFILATIVIILGVTLGVVLYHNKYQAAQQQEICPADVMMCPDGTSIPRSGKGCEFGVCGGEVTSSGTELPTLTSNIPSEKNKDRNTAATPPIDPEVIPQPTPNPTLFSKIATSVARGVSVVTTSVISGFSGTKIEENNGPQETKKPKPFENNSPIVVPKINPLLDETKYAVKNGAIIDNTTNSVIYTLSASTTSNLGSSNSGWENHTVNVVPVGDVAPVINAIPITGLPGKYYLSENSFGNIQKCEFSNKIFILDTNTNEVTLMYEENSSTLSHDDPRSCTSEIFLLATEESKLVLKYHTLNTNTLCDSSWSEPERTWYLDVTQLGQGMKRYSISKERYDLAEEGEALCREKL